MAEYIDREALVARIKDLPTWWADAGGVYGKSMKYPDGMFDCKDVVSLIENASAADVAPVVRCKDCKHSWEDIGGLCCSHGVCVDITVPDDFYCAYGIRKEGEESVQIY